ncbi:MAG: type I secretion system permease/ATPase, partial [Rubrivivax sp.]
MTHRTSVLGAMDKVLLLVDGAQQAFGPRDDVLAALQKAQTQAQVRPASAAASLPAASPSISPLPKG